MSIEGVIAAEIAARLDDQVSQFREVKALASEDEFDLLFNVPSCGIVVTEGEESEHPPRSDGTQWIHSYVIVIYSNLGFQGGDNLDDTDGAYDTFDDVTSAIKSYSPTGAFAPLVYVNHSRGILEKETTGVLVTRIRYRTGTSI